ncbi:MAG: T9SS type A sorting domain-containing protein [Vicingaceae bacterium]|nr:T9SS type A sorting domain-containing protein [Vicingaceae bacterium]
MFFNTSKRLLILAISFLLVVNYKAQDIPIGTWRDHLPYSDAISVSYGNQKVYCATGSAMFIYSQLDNSVERLNLVNSLTDIGLSKIKFIPHNERVIVTYQNGNIDILDTDNSITNIPFITTSSIIGSKKINHIFIKNQYAYLSTDFGIVLIDTDKKEVADTYFYGALGVEMVTNAVTMDNQYIYAASDNGIYFADFNNPNLSNFNNWNFLTDLGNRKFSSIVYFSNILFASSDTSVSLGDTIFFNFNSVWQQFSTIGQDIENLQVLSGNRLAVNKLYTTEIFDENLMSIREIFTYNGVPSVSNEVALDASANLWFADNFKGLVKVTPSNAVEFIIPDGPSTSTSYALDMRDDNLWMVSGGFVNQVNQNNLNHRKEGTWLKFPQTIQNPEGGILTGLVDVAIHPKNIDNVFVGSWSNGLIELNNDQVTNVYNARNSPLDSVFFGPTQVGTLNFDSDDNLWVTSSFPSNNRVLHVKTADNNWFSYTITGSSSNFFSSALVDRNDYKWIVSPTNKTIIVFDENKTFSNTSDDRFITLGGGANIGDIPGSAIYCIEQDLDGKIWLGTDEGVAVFFSPDAIFDGEVTANQIFVEQDGNVEVLLGTETVTAIVVDGANRKWFGTQNSGVFLMSADGTEEVFHFTENNSPLFSNHILDITINHTTGEVFFATSKGLLSYKSTATEPLDDYELFVYPNPVKPDFNGTIAIRGMVVNSNVKITDIEGNIVYETTSLGGQAIWDGKNINGERVKSGIYMVFANSEDGSQKKAGKILILN